MAILRTIKCEICGEVETETAPGYGWPGWGHVGGIEFNGVEQPCLCPEHLAKVADYLDSINDDRSKNE